MQKEVLNIEGISFKTNGEGLPGTNQRAGHLLAGGTISSANSTLVKALVGTYDAIAPGFDTLALHTDGGGVWAAGCAIGHLRAAEMK